MIVDYFGVTEEKKPSFFLPSFESERFRGKGIGKFIIHMIQSIANVICESGSMVLLKCNKELSTFYQGIGFERINVNKSEILKIDKVIQHYKEIQLEINIFSYVLKSSVNINHKKNSL